MLATVLAVGLALTPAPAQEKNRTAPAVVTPGSATKAPSDAVVLFDGRNLDHWRTRGGGPAQCEVLNAEMVCKTGSGDLYSVETFRDAQIHLEFAVPFMPDQKGQLRGNSGVFLQSCYEVQILDSYENPTYLDGMLGAVYGFSAPMVNAARKPEEWQTYDMIYHAPRCDAAGAMAEPGRVTILLNGVLVQENVAINKKGGGCQLDSLCQPGPLRLQDHSGFKDAPHTVMKFRNIWLRHLSGGASNQK